jgi:hypothetical protein
MKGIDFRADEILCRNVTELARAEIGRQRVEADRVRSESGPPWFPHYPPTEPTDQEWEPAIACCAVEAHRLGYTLFAMAPDLLPSKARALFAKAYPRSKAGHARWEDWLSIIAEFEDDEASGQGAKAQVFARYRRALDGICFT